MFHSYSSSHWARSMTQTLGWRMRRQLLLSSFALATLMGAPTSAVAQSDASQDARTARAIAGRHSCVVTVDYIPFEYCARDLVLQEDEVAFCRDLDDRREPCFAIARRTCELVGGQVIEVVDRMDGNVRWPLCESGRPGMAQALEFARALLESPSYIDEENGYFFRTFPVSTLGGEVAAYGERLRYRTADYLISWFVAVSVQSHTGGEREMGLRCNPDLVRRRDLTSNIPFDYSHPDLDHQGVSWTSWCAFARYCAVGLAIAKEDDAIAARISATVEAHREAVGGILGSLAQGVLPAHVRILNRGAQSETCSMLRDASDMMIELETGSLPVDNALALLLLGFDRLPGPSDELSSLTDDRRRDLIEATHAAISMIDQIPPSIDPSGEKWKFDIHKDAFIAANIFATHMVEQLLAEHDASLSDVADSERPENE